MDTNTPEEQDLIKEFAEAWEEEFGEAISIEQARIELNNLVHLAYRLGRPCSEPRS